MEIRRRERVRKQRRNRMGRGSERRGREREDHFRRKGMTDCGGVTLRDLRTYTHTYIVKCVVRWNASHLSLQCTGLHEVGVSQDTTPTLLAETI